MLTISYDGTRYHGWQVQKNAITVQETVQNGLEAVLGVRPPLTGCSRTDAGVHAREFCCHLDCEDKIPENAFLKGLAAVLPRDITVLAVKRVENNFHARYNALGKTYTYRILNSCTADPFECRYSWHIERPLNLEAMNEFCSQLKGEHDFAGFSSSGRTVESTVRTVSDCHVERTGNIVTLTVTADGFLYNMVRIIVGTAVAVSDGRCELPLQSGIFENGRRSLAGDTAPPQGLFLQKVLYPEEQNA